MRAKILQMIDAKLAGAIDHSYQIRMNCGGLPPDQLDREYGLSGKSCRQVMEDCEKAAEEARAMRVWFMVNTTEGE